jgi:hypothetical protein
MFTFLQIAFDYRTQLTEEDVLLRSSMGSRALHTAVFPAELLSCSICYNTYPI